MSQWRRFTWFIWIAALIGCSQNLPLGSNQKQELIDYAFVRTGYLQFVTVTGRVLPTTITAAPLQPIVLPSGEEVVYVAVIGEKYQLMLQNQVTTTVTPLVPLAALPNSFIPSYGSAVMGFIVADELFLVFLQTHEVVRVHEGVTAAQFTDSQQRIIYTTTDGRVLQRDFTTTGELTAAVAATQEFTQEGVEIPDTVQMWGWSRLGDAVYYVSTHGEVTKVEL